MQWERRTADLEPTCGNSKHVHLTADDALTSQGLIFYLPVWRGAAAAWGGGRRAPGAARPACRPYTAARLVGTRPRSPGRRAHRPGLGARACFQAPRGPPVAPPAPGCPSNAHSGPSGASTTPVGHFCSWTFPLSAQLLLAFVSHIERRAEWAEDGRSLGGVTPGRGCRGRLQLAPSRSPGNCTVRSSV